MARSNTEPEPVEIKRMRIEDEGLAVDLLLHWDITSYEEEDVDGNLHTVWEYEEELKTLHFDGNREQARNFIRAHESEMLTLGRAKAEARREEPVLTTEDKDTLAYPSFKADSSYYGQIAEIDTGRSDKKYLNVEKTVDGETVSAWCYADYSLLLAHQNNELSVGDTVIISFVDEDLDKPYAEGKVVGF